MFAMSFDSEVFGFYYFLPVQDRNGLYTLENGGVKIALGLNLGDIRHCWRADVVSFRTNRQGWCMLVV